MGRNDNRVEPVKKDLYFRWASQGAGTRSIPYNSGFVYLFRKAGLIQEGGSRFASMSFTSGGLFFATPFFWSETFFRHTAFAANAQELADFVNVFAAAYNQVWNPLIDVVERGRDMFWAQVLFQQEISARSLLENVLNVFAAAIGDPGFFSRPAAYDNRVPSLRTTDVYLATSIHPNARLRDGFGKGKDSLTYLGPSNSESVFG